MTKNNLQITQNRYSQPIKIDVFISFIYMIINIENGLSTLLNSTFALLVKNKDIIEKVIPTIFSVFPRALVLFVYILV